MKRHPGTFLHEEEYEPVIFRSFNSNSIEFLLEVMGIFGPLNAQLLKRHVVHLLDEFLATWIIPCVIQEADGVACLLRAQTHVFDG